MDEKRKEMEPLQQALGKLRGASGGRERGSVICSSEEELNDVVRYHIYYIYIYVFCYRLCAYDFVIVST